MGWQFPTGREEKRQVLLAAVERVRDTLLAGADEAEANATLPLTTVQALDDAGLLALKLPAALGGAEADLVTQLEVLEAVTYIDTSAGWCILIGAAAIASPGAFLVDEAIAQSFAGGLYAKRPGCPRRRWLSGQWTMGVRQRHSSCPVGQRYGARDPRGSGHASAAPGGAASERCADP